MKVPDLLQPGDVVDSLAKRHVPRLSWTVRSAETIEPGAQRVHASGQGIGSVIFTWGVDDSGVRAGRSPSGFVFLFKERPKALSLALRFMASFNCEAEDSTSSRLYTTDAKAVELALRSIRPSLEQLAEAIRRDGLVSNSDKWTIAESVMKCIENPTP